MSRIAPLPPAVLLADESAKARAACVVDIVQPLAVRTARILSLILVLEALREAPAIPDRQKV